MYTLKRPLAVRVLPRPRKILKSTNTNYTTSKHYTRRDIWDLESDEDDDEPPLQSDLSSEWDLSVVTPTASSVSPPSFDHNFGHGQTELHRKKRRKLTVVEDEEEGREPLGSGEQELDVFLFAEELIDDWAQDLAPFHLDATRSQDSQPTSWTHSQPVGAGREFVATPPSQLPTDSLVATLPQQEDETSEANFVRLSEASKTMPAVLDEDQLVQSAASLATPIPFPPDPPPTELGEDEDTIVVAMPPPPTTPDPGEDEDTIVVAYPSTPIAQRPPPSRRNPALISVDVPMIKVKSRASTHQSSIAKRGADRPPFRRNATRVAKSRASTYQSSITKQVREPPNARRNPARICRHFGN